MSSRDQESQRHKMIYSVWKAPSDSSLLTEVLELAGKKSESFTHRIMYFKVTGHHKQEDKIAEEVQLTSLSTYLPVTRWIETN